MKEVYYQKNLKIIFNNKKYIKTTILYLFHDESSKTDVQFKSCKIGSNKKSIIKCYNDFRKKRFSKIV